MESHKKDKRPNDNNNNNTRKKDPLEYIITGMMNKYIQSEPAIDKSQMYYDKNLRHKL